jgi:DNA-binding GntR family transcriptional regulator
MNRSSDESSQKQPLGVMAFQQIYRKIMTLEYEPGRRLEEKQLMEGLNIGRTPIREALLRLAADFMVESHPNMGFVVRPITLQNTKAAFAALKIMELGVAELAVRQDVGCLLEQMQRANQQVAEAIAQRDIVGLVDANSRFHQHLADCSRNDYLIHGLHKVRCETDRLAYMSFSSQIDPIKPLEEHYRSVIDQHRTIIDSIRKRDEPRLKEALIEHTQAFQNRIILYMAS